MKTLRTLSTRQLDRLQDRLDAHLRNAITGTVRGKIIMRMYRLANERMRRIGL